MSNNLDEHDFFNEFSERGIAISDEQKRRIQEKINSVLSYEPRIGIFSKSGAGKSSLCNALFGKDVCEISDVAACTRKPQEVLLNMGDKGLKLVDMPGVGESSRRDKEYTKLYSNLLPEIDLVLWLIKADDRAFTTDEAFYKNIVKPHINAGKPFFFVITQSDKIEPSEDWDSLNLRPGVIQLTNINLKIQVVSSYFDITVSKIIPVSAKYGWNLVTLVDEIVFSLPREKKITFLRGIAEENRSFGSINEVKKAWYEIVGEFFMSVIGMGRDVILNLLNKSGSVLEVFLDKLFHRF